VIEFRDSYVVPASAANAETTDTASDGTDKKKGRTITLTTEDMQKRKNDVKARTTLLLSLPDEHQQRFKGSETLEQTFNRLQVIISQLQFIDVEIEQDDLNQKFLTSLAPEWLMHMIIWRKRSDIDTISLDDLYNHLKIYEDDMEDMDIKWNMALLSMRADKFWKKTGKKISIQRSDVARFDKSKVECFNCHKMGHFARECRAPRSQDRGRTDNYIQGSKVKEHAPKALMAIDGVGWDWSYMKLELIKKEKESLDSKLAGFQTASKDLDSLHESQRLVKNKEVLGYSAVSPPPAQIYSSPKKDMSWTGLPEFKDDTITNYSRPAPIVESSTDDAQNKSPSVTKTEA
nr:hypothetical protein [Tanacetum cinerariifolium]